MKVTGKCKEDFEKWRISKKDSYLKHCFFEDLDDSMQYGVLIDFFDSVGIRILIDMDFGNFVFNKFVLYIEYKKNCFCNYGMNFKTRQEARTAAVKMANEIYNSK